MRDQKYKSELIAPQFGLWPERFQRSKMTRDEAEETVMAVEVGFGNHYNITKAQYAEALLILARPEPPAQEEGSQEPL